MASMLLTLWTPMLLILESSKTIGQLELERDAGEKATRLDGP